MTARWRPTPPTRRATPDVTVDPPDDALLSAAEIAAWLHVDDDWLPRAIAEDKLPVMGWASDGSPVVAAGEVRAWLRRPPKGGVAAKIAAGAITARR